MRSCVELDLHVAGIYRDAMANIVTIRRLTKPLRSLGVFLRVAALIFLMAFPTVGLTFQPCQCACSQDDKSCCCSPKKSNCCCNCECENSGLGCSCVFCTCKLGIEVESTSLPLINDSVNPMVFTTTISLTSSKPSLAALLRPDRTAVTPHARLHALNCRWLI